MKELPKEARVLLALMRAAMEQEQTEIPLEPGCDLEQLQDLMRRQGLVSMVYPAIQQQKGEGWSRLQEGLAGLYHQFLYCGIVQEHEMGALLDRMEQDGIDCLPLKGWILRTYYPEPLMRTMGDLDVYIRDFDAGKMRRWMEQEGYTPCQVDEESVHDIYQKPPFTHVEIHRRLVDTNCLWNVGWGRTIRLMEDIWAHRVLAEGKKHTYRMRDEDFYLYHLVHFYKHFFYEGAGLRMLADTYILLRRKGGQLDWAYISRRLEMLGIQAFAEQIRKLTLAAFTGEEMDQDAMEAIAFLTQGTAHGEWENEAYILFAKQGTGSAGQDASTMVRRQLFPSRRALQQRYPRLRTMPWLLPFYWVARGCRVAFLERFKLEELKTNAGQIKQLDPERYAQMRKVYRYLKLIH